MKAPTTALEPGSVDELCDPDVPVERAVSTADEWARRIPADTFRHTEAQPRQDVNTRLDRTVGRLTQPTTAGGW
ncbi:hypothetical protein ACFYOT_19350 [Saccharothrix saharensis]|uniref:hypothetical protein n=1 Tax=Saccharothrix saharensis TaxID=571190 RepID=UPI0036A0FE93